MDVYAVTHKLTFVSFDGSVMFYFDMTLFLLVFTCACVCVCVCVWVWVWVWVCVCVCVEGRLGFWSQKFFAGLSYFSLYFSFTWFMNPLLTHFLYPFEVEYQQKAFKRITNKRHYKIVFKIQFSMWFADKMRIWFIFSLKEWTTLEFDSSRAKPW